MDVPSYSTNSSTLLESKIGGGGGGGIVETETSTNTAIHPVTFTKITEVMRIISIILSKQCRTCLDNFTSGVIQSDMCNNNCAYNSAGLAVFLNIYMQNIELFDSIFETSIETFINFKNVSIPAIEINITSQDGTIIKTRVNTESFFRGVTNSIGLLWDVHDFTDQELSVEEYSKKYTPSGIMLALNNPLLKEEWFINDTFPQLRQGINLISFYVTERDGVNISYHHAFVFVYDTQCVLGDSWLGSSGIYDNYGRLIKMEKISRPLTLRKLKLSTLQKFLNILNQPFSEDNRLDKLMIMKGVFKGYQNDGRNNTYLRTKVCILKQEILNKVIYEGFSVDRYLFGGKRKRNKSKRTNNTLHKKNKNTRKSNKKIKELKIKYPRYI